MNRQASTAWALYEAGKEYKRRIGLYETVRQNERFYRGDQWSATDSELPRPVFNMIRRITDYLVCAVLPGDLSIHYSDEGLPFLESSVQRERVMQGIDSFNRNAAYRWKREGMQSLVHRALLNAAISGDGVFYCRWDGSLQNGHPYAGEIRTELIENTDLFVADINSTDLQAQDYILLSGRATVESLRREAIENGVSEHDARLIVGDGSDTAADSFSSYELRGSEKATYLIRFFRENGEVIFEKTTRSVLLRRVNTGLKHYPVAYFNWNPTKGCFHGTAPVSDMIANQKYVNTAYAMVMKHMYDTAFSKVIYDKSRIPEWSNEVGEAIAAVGGGNVSDAVSVVGTGTLQNGYLELIQNVIDTTKDMMCATEAALGDAPAHNTSALLTLQEASRLALHRVRSELIRAVSEVATIWADMVCTYYPPERLLLTLGKNGTAAERPDYTLLRRELLSASVQVGEADTYTPAATVNLLDKLLAEGYLDAHSYIALLPPGSVTDRDAILNQIHQKGDSQDE